MAPAYSPPQTAAPVAFKEAPAGWADARPASVDPDGKWWKRFGDPDLDRLEDQLAVASPDLAQAVARLDAARGAARGAAAELYPEISAGGRVQRARASGRRPLSASGPDTYTETLLGGSMAWEIDLWGRLGDNARASRAQAESAAADLAATRLSLQARLADAYFRLRGLDAQAKLLAQSVDAFTRARDLTDTRHDGGIASGLDVNRAQTILSDARAQQVAVGNARAATEHEIAALVGEVASSFALPARAIALQPPAIPPVVPAALLERRPDVASAERRIAAANARIGVARAAFFPTISLSAGGGVQSARGSLFATPATYWALGPLAAALPLFDAGRRKSDLDVAKAEHAEAAAQYRSTVLLAFREVEDALAAIRTLASQGTEQRTAAEAAQRTTDLALVRYRDGASDYLEVVTAQTSALVAEREAIAIDTERMRATVALVRATGGDIERPVLAGGE